MKKFLAISLAIFMVVCLAACGSNSNSNETTSNTQTQLTESTTDNKDTTEEDITPSKFEQFEQGLRDKNIQFEITQKDATMVGAKEGYGYSFADETSVEIYLFDTSNDAYKDAAKNNKLNLIDFGITMEVVFNDDICIYFNGEPTNKADIQIIFDNIK